MPLLKQRVLILTISRVDDQSILVNVIPKKRDNEADENSALTQPLSFTGKPEELDREFPGQLAAFTESLLKTGSNLEDLKGQHAAAIKAVEAENRKRLDEKKKAGGKSAPAAEKKDAAAEFRDGKPVFGSKPASGPTAPASLFDDVEPGGDATAPSPVNAAAEA
jgi:PRTRC genetic system protein E